MVVESSLYISITFKEKNMDGTILGQGTFSASLALNPLPGSASVAAGNPVIIQVPSAADWVRVVDYTQGGIVGSASAYFQGTANAHTAVEYYWQRGMPAGSALVRYYGTGTAVVSGD